MSVEFEVVPVQELIESPSFWQLASSKEKQFAEALTQALNERAQSGWIFAGTYGGIGSAYLIFRKET